MGFLYNLGNVFKIGFDKVNQTTNEIYGAARKYTVNQRNKEVPFEQGYAKSSDIYSIVRKIASNAKTIPWILKKRTGDKVEIVTSGDLYDLIQNPNPQQSRQEYTEEGLNHLLLSGNVFFHSPETFGQPIDETFLQHPQLMDIKTKLDGRIIVPEKYIYRIGGKEFKSDPDKITHLKYCNPTEYGIASKFGLSPLTAGFLSMIAVNNNQTANASLLENQAVAGIVSNESEEMLSSDEQKEQQTLWDAMMGGATKFGRWIQSRSKLKFHKLGLDATQLKIIESKVMIFIDLCNVWDVDPNLFGSVKGTTFNNIKAAHVSLYTGPITSNLELFLGAFHKEIVSKFNKREFPKGNSEYFIELDFSGVIVLQEDDLKKAQKGKALSETVIGILTKELTDNQKIKTLVLSLKMPEEEAKELVGNSDNDN